MACCKLPLLLPFNSFSASKKKSHYIVLARPGWKNKTDAAQTDIIVRSTLSKLVAASGTSNCLSCDVPPSTSLAFGSRLFFLAFFSLQIIVTASARLWFFDVFQNLLTRFLRERERYIYIYISHLQLYKKSGSLPSLYPELRIRETTILRFVSPIQRSFPNENSGSNYNITRANRRS